MNPDFYNLENLLRIPYVDPDMGYDISIDGKTIAYSWNITGRWEIYILNLEVDTDPVQITDKDGSKFSPSWSPDGRKLAYVLDLNGGENYDIYIWDSVNGVHTNLTPDSTAAISTEYDWSPDGKWIAYCSDQQGQFNVYIMPCTGGQSHNIYCSSYPDWSVIWSPDGRNLAVVSEATGQDQWITIVPINGNDPKIISIGGNPICAKDASWSEDGSKLAFSSNFLGQFDIAIYDIETGRINWITEGEGEKEHPEWISAGALVYTTSYGPKVELSIRKIQGDEICVSKLEPGVIYLPRYDPNHHKIFFVFDNPRHPCDLWSYSIDSQQLTQITHSFPKAINPDNLVMPAEIKYPGLDGTDVPALLYRPRIEDIRKLDKLAVPDGSLLPPSVIYIHGGPNWLSQITWDPLLQYMVAQGWAVLAPNYRGSTGYGKEWQLANRFDLGGVDTDDIVAGAIYLVNEKISGSDQIAVTGRSWGGYLTMTCLTQYPHTWAAGSAVVPFLNWFTGHENSRRDLQHWDRENFGDPIKDKKLWYERSPYFHLDRIEAPVQLICGAHDVRCPASESAAGYQKLKELGKNCEYHLYPDEGHSFLKVENQVKSKKQQVEFLAKYLGERQQ